MKKHVLKFVFGIPFLLLIIFAILSKNENKTYTNTGYPPSRNKHKTKLRTHNTSQTQKYTT